MKPFDFIWSDSYVLVLGQVPKQRGVSHRRPQKSASNWCTSSTSSKLAAVLEPFGKDFQGDRRCQEISGVSFDRSHCHRVPVPTNPHLEIGLCRAPGINTIKLFCCNWWLHQFSLDYVEGFFVKTHKSPNHASNSSHKCAAIYCSQKVLYYCSQNITENKVSELDRILDRGDARTRLDSPNLLLVKKWGEFFVRYRKNNPK